MPKLTYAENPVHPVLNDYPSALVPASLAFDMLHLVTRRPTFRNASFFSLLLALLTGIPAAVAGLRDYEHIPEGTEAKRIANVHAVINTGVLGAVALGLLMRMFGRVGFLARALNLAANGGLVVAGWYGTHLVYRHGMRVRGVDPLATAPEAGPDTGKPYADRLEAFAAGVPATDLRDLANRAGAGVSEVGRQTQSALQDAASAVSARADEVRTGQARGHQATEVEEDGVPVYTGAEDEELLETAATSRTDLPEDFGR
jgi:uncharacterized membrane protein